MTGPDRDGAWRPYPAQRPDEETPQPGPQQPEQNPDYRPPAGRAAVRPEFAAPHAALPPPPPMFAAQPAAPSAAQPAPPPVVARASVPVQARPAQAAPESTTDQAGRRLAAPAVTSAPLAAPAAVALADALATDRPDDGPPSETRTQADAEARVGPSGRMSRLHVGRHRMSRAALRNVTVAPSAGAGLVLGRDRQHTAVPLRLFAPEPVRVALIGGVWAAQLLIFRAFALGARVTVVTTEPRAWAGFGERATGQYNRLIVLDSDQGQSLTGTAQTPTLAVYDLGLAGPATPPSLGPWRTQLTILRQFDRPGVPAVQDATYTLLQRLGGDETSLAASALKLRRHSGQFLQFMADDMMALIEDGTERYVFLAQTGIEQQHVGLPRR